MNTKLFGLFIALLVVSLKVALAATLHSSSIENAISSPTASSPGSRIENFLIRDLIFIMRGRGACRVYLFTSFSKGFLYSSSLADISGTA